VISRRRFRATTAHCPGRLPSIGSSTLHRGSTRALPFNRSHALASHPCRENELAPARHEQDREADAFLRAPRAGPVDQLSLDRPAPETCPPALSRVRHPRKRGHQIDTKDTSHRLLQTDYLERAPIGSVTCPCAPLTSRVTGSSRAGRAFQRRSSRRSARTPADRSPSNILRARVRLTTHQELW